MGSKPSLRSAAVTAAKFSYYEIVSIVALSLAFWAVSLLVVTAGGALVALFETIGSIPRENASARERVRAFLRSTRANARDGAPLSLLLAATCSVTLLYFAIAVGRGSPLALVGGVFGVYCVLAAVFLSLRIARVMASSDAGFRAAAAESLATVRQHYAVAVLHVCLIAALLAVSVPFPAALFLLAPGVLAVLEALVHEEIAQPDRSIYRRHLATLR